MGLSFLESWEVAVGLRQQQAEALLKRVKLRDAEGIVIAFSAVEKLHSSLSALLARADESEIEILFYSSEPENADFMKLLPKEKNESA